MIDSQTVFCYHVVSNGGKWIEFSIPTSNMYFGQVYTQLDEKNRLTFPSRFRKTMEELGHTEFFMCRGFDGCLFIFPRQPWEEIMADSRKHGKLDKKAVKVRRALFASVQEVSPDNQGRVPVPEHLREYACLDKEAALIGTDDHIELWNRSGWKDYQRKSESEYNDLVSDFFSGESTESGDDVAAAEEVVS